MALTTHFLSRILDSYMTLVSIQAERKANLVIIQDYSSVASIARNIIEACNLNYYLCVEDCPDDETELRFLIADFHSISETKFVIENMFRNKKEIEILMTDLKIRATELDENVKFQKLDKQLQKNILSGKRGSIFTQYEIAKRRCIDLPLFKSMYKIMSVQTHSAPYALDQLRLLKKDKSFDEHNQFFSAYITEYTNSFLAKTIQEISKMWNMKFGIKSSKLFIDECEEIF